MEAKVGDFSKYCESYCNAKFRASASEGFLDPVGSLVSTLWVGCGLWVVGHTFV